MVGKFFYKEGGFLVKVIFYNEDNDIVQLEYDDGSTSRPKKLKYWSSWGRRWNQLSKLEVLFYGW